MKRSSSEVTEDVDVVVVGAGIVGLAAATRLHRLRPDLGIAVVEKEADVAAHQSSHNSGVLHAGVYYEPGSLKARLCRLGKSLVEDYAAEVGVKVETNGKLIVAVTDEEKPRLTTLAGRAEANGVPGLELVDGGGIRRIEPAARGVAALHSPSTAVVDFAAVAHHLADDVRRFGAVHTVEPVTGIDDGDDLAVVHTADRSFRARGVLCAAGLQADRLARFTHPGLDVRIVPFRGSYRTLVGEAAGWVNGSIYPVPDPRLPFLGVHVTRHVDGKTTAGPTAFLAFAREEYRRGALSARDAGDALAYPGLWRFALAHPGATVGEGWREISSRAFLTAARRYVPDLSSEHLGERAMGIRAQAMTGAGDLVDDFSVVSGRRVVHVLNAPSPAATASFAIGDVLARRLVDVMER